MKKVNKDIKIKITMLALVLIVTISVISINKEIPMITSANSEKTIGWGIKRENNHYNQMLEVKIKRS